MWWNAWTQWIPEILRKCFDSIWQLTLPWIITISLIMLLCPYLLRRYSAKCYLHCMRYMMVSLFLSMTMYGTGAYWQLPGPDVWFSQQTREEAVEEMPVQADWMTETAPATEKQTDAQVLPQIQSEREQTEARETTHKTAFPELYQIWAVGMALFLLFHVVQYGRLQWYLHQGREKITDPALLECYQQLHREMPILIRKPQLYCHRDLPSSICVGLFRKTIYVDTQDRDLEETKWVLRHELYHCDNGDTMGRWLFLLVQAMHWFNPLMYWLMDELEWVTELECDAKVVDGASVQERRAYSMAILHSIRDGNRKRARLSTAFVENRETLQKRLEAIVDMQQKKTGGGIPFLVCVLLMFCFSFVGCTPVEPQKQEAKAVQTDLTRELYDARTPFIGGASEVGKILGLLPLPAGLTPHEEGMELFTDADSPFGVRQHLMFTESATEVEKQELLLDTEQLERNAYLFLALVDNADFLEYQIHDTPATESVTFHFDRQMAEKYYGDIDLRSFTSDFDTFAAFVEEINVLFDCPFTETLETAGRENWVENQRMAMELVQKMANDIPMTTDRTVWIDQVRESDTYEQLLALGDDALLSCLSEMTNGTNTENEIMMLAADELVSGSRLEAAKFQASPEEWYQAYCALDARYVAPFYLGLEEAYAAMPEAEYLSLSKEASRSRVTSKEKAVQAVYKALSQYEQEETLDGHTLTVFAPLILDVAETEDTLQVCCVVGEDKYRMNRIRSQGDCLIHEGGSQVPARLDFVKEQGEWKLEEIHWAKDGSYYPSSIEEMAPNKAVAQKMIDFDSEELTRLLYDNLIQYQNQTDTAYVIYDMGEKSAALQQELRRFLQLA